MTHALLDTWRALIRQASQSETEAVRVAALREAERLATAIEKLPPSGPQVAEAKLEIILWQANRAFDGVGPAARPELVSV